jgi:2-C-methyl-D-erythritol 4-phosphate cytidylyltransferase
MKKTAVIVAAGSGIRMGSELPKQFHEMNGKPVLWHSIKAFTDAYDDIEVVVVLPATFLDLGAGLSLEFPAHVVRTTSGGASRFESVRNGLELVDDDSLVLVHDAARCLVTPALVQRCVEAATSLGNAIPAIESNDSLRVIIGDRNEQISREWVRLIQTPQVFKADILKRAFQQDYEPSFTDEATVAENLGVTIHLVPGERENLKITTPADLAVAELLLKKRNG